MKKYEDMQHGKSDFPIGIHHTTCNRGFSLYPHIHREFEFLVMEEGRGIIYIENEKVEIKAGEGIFVNSEELHIGVKTDSERAKFFAVVFAPEIFGNFGMDVIMQKYVEPVIKGKIRPERRIEKEGVELLCRMHKEKSELKIKAMLFEVWDICIKGAKREEAEKSKSVEEIKRVLAYIRENYDKEITLEDMAGFINISKSYLCREFKRVLHMSPFDYLTQIRIDAACEMLKNTQSSIGEIATMCGFNSFSYFSKIFSERVGVSPREYRK